MKNIVSLFIILSLNSCGPVADKLKDVFNKTTDGGGDPRKSLQSGREFSKYREIFEDDYRLFHGRDVNTDHVPINFGEMPNKGIAAVCVTYNFKYKEILIDKSYWETSLDSHAKRNALIQHELGHCILNRGHNNKIATIGGETLKGSYMHEASIVNDGHLSEFNNYYVEELFGTDRNHVIEEYYEARGL